MLILFFEAMSCDLWNKYLAFTFTTKVAPQFLGAPHSPIYRHMYSILCPHYQISTNSRKCSLARPALRTSPKSVPCNRSSSCGCF